MLACLACASAVQVIKTLLLLASAHAAMNNLEALRSVMDRVVKIHSARWKGWGDKLLSFPLFHIQARVAGEAGDVDSKRRLLETLLYRQQEEYGARGAFDVIDVMVDLAEALVQLGDTTAARKLALRAVEMKDQLRVPDIIWAGSQVKLAGVWGGLGELGKKKEMLEEVLQVQIGYNGSSNHEQVRTLRSREVCEFAPAVMTGVLTGRMGLCGTAMAGDHHQARAGRRGPADGRPQA